MKGFNIGTQHPTLKNIGFTGHRYPKLIFLFVFMGGLISCESFIGSSFDSTREPATHEVVFDQFWQEFSDYYPYFQHKNVNWNQLYEVYRPLVDSVTTQEELFDVLEQMIYRLKDGHIMLESPFKRYQYYDWYRSDYNGNLIFANYLNYQLQEDESGIFSYGRIQDILYVHLASFKGQKQSFKQLAQVISHQLTIPRGLS